MSEREERTIARMDDTIARLEDENGVLREALLNTPSADPTMRQGLFTWAMATAVQHPEQAIEWTWSAAWITGYKAGELAGSQTRTIQFPFHPNMCLIGGIHTYLSTGCLHGDHAYCQGYAGAAGDKIPAVCKFCGTKCLCDCHKGAGS